MTYSKCVTQSKKKKLPNVKFEKEDIFPKMSKGLMYLCEWSIVTLKLSIPRDSCRLQHTLKT